MFTNQKRLLAPSTRAYVQHYVGKQQRGGGVGNGQFGHIYAGNRFPQRGGGIGTFLAGVVRGISSLISRTPSWVKTGAKIVGSSALRNIGDYAGDVQAGADPKLARKRALKSTVADIMEETGKKMRGSGTLSKRKKKKCCRIVKKRLVGGGSKRKRKRFPKKAIRKTNTRPVKRKKKKKMRSIKTRSKFDLLSV